jgi:hypothetical protein
MIEFQKPTNLNGKELLEELDSAGVIVNGRPEVELEILRLDITATDKAKAEKVIAQHNGTTTDVDRSAEKAALLERLGITAEEAALLLA